MSNEDLWGELPAGANVRPPVQILNEQATALTKKTNGTLVGLVQGGAMPALLMLPSALPQNSFQYTLLIRAPALNNYTATVLVISHPIGMYPLELSINAPRVASVTCNDEEHFVQQLRLALQNAAIRNLISSLLAQSQSAPSDTEV